MSGSSDLYCWGISRELAHSPGREADDAAILRATGRELEAIGFSVSFKTPEEVASVVEEVPPFLFLMCETLPILTRLREWEERGVCQVNSPLAVLNTYRDRMVSLFQRDGIAFPRSVLVPTAAPLRDPSDPRDHFPSCWVKRGDVHNTREGDVVFASEGAAISEALRGLARRGIARAVLQEHVPGDLIKFYGVGRVESGAPSEAPDPDGLPWFQWFYHREQELAGYWFDPDALASTAARAAASLGLEIYGGDAIATRQGTVVLIDLNAWPSFALYRSVASARIASYLSARFRREVEVPK